MAKKEINIFGTSFLDLLSGALAAVIILFVIVPKMTADQQNALEEIERLNVQVEQLEDIMERVRNTVPQEIYDEIMEQLEQLQQTISELTSQVEGLQQRLSTAEAENERLRREVAELDRLRQENQRLHEQIQQLQAQQPQQNGQGISDGKIFGIDAEVGVVCFWRENVDVDLFVKNLETGEICYFNEKETEFGNLNEDIQERDNSNSDRFELFYQSNVVPGRYEISLLYYQDNTGNNTIANVEGYMVMHPGKPNQIKIPYPNQRLSDNDREPVVIGVMTVRENSISFQRQ